MPGITVCPGRSRTSAPGGISTAPAGPTAAIRFPSITTVWFVRAPAPVPSMTLTPVRATAGPAMETNSEVASPSSAADWAGR